MQFARMSYIAIDDDADFIITSAWLKLYTTVVFSPLHPVIEVWRTIAVLETDVRLSTYVL